MSNEVKKNYAERVKRQNPILVIQKHSLADVKTMKVFFFPNYRLNFNI